MRLVPDQSPVQQLVAATLDPPFHDGVHTGPPDTAEHDADTGVGEDRVEQRGEFAVPMADDVPRRAAGVVQVHGEVAYGLGDPRGGGMCGGAENADAAAGVLDHGEDVQPAPR